MLIYLESASSSLDLGYVAIHHLWGPAVSGAVSASIGLQRFPLRIGTMFLFHGETKYGMSEMA